MSSAAAGRTSSPRPSLAGAFRGEVIKVSRQLSVYAMLVAALALLAVIVLATSTAGRAKADLATDPSRFIDDLMQIYGTVFQVGSGIFLLIVATRLLAMEYSSGTIRILYARGLGRVQLLLTKLAVLFVLGLAILGGYALVVSAIVVVTVSAWSGSLAPLAQVSATEWGNVERSVVFYAANLLVLLTVAAAAGAVGRSLAFAVPAALALFPADNFGSVILSLVARVTSHQHPWLDINQWFLGPNLNYVLSLWETTHPRPAFAAPLVPVDLTHTVLVIGAWGVALFAVAVVRTVGPDVLE